MQSPAPGGAGPSRVPSRASRGPTDVSIEASEEDRCRGQAPSACHPKNHPSKIVPGGRPRERQCGTLPERHNCICRRLTGRVRRVGKPSGRSSSGYAVKVGLVLVGLVLGVAVGLVAGRGLALQPSAEIYRGLNRDVVLAPFVARAEDGIELFGLNDSGQYFGTKGYAVEYLAGRLDLVACVGEAGERGYCYYDELDGESTGDIGLYRPTARPSSGDLPPWMRISMEATRQARRSSVP